MGDDVAGLLAAPFEIQLALASGYVAYTVGFSEARRRHGAVDALMLTLAFGLIAVAAHRLAAPLAPPLAAALAAFCATVAAGAAWQAQGRRLWRRAARWSGLSIEDGAPDVFGTVFQDARFPVTQVTVRLRSGRILHSDGLRGLFDAPFGPCVLGPDGSLGLYVTEITGADGVVTPWDPLDGDPQITLIPAAEVLEIDVRHYKPDGRVLRVGGR